MRAEIKLTDVKDIRDLHEYINAELRLRRVAPTLEALQAALEMPKTEAVSYTHLTLPTIRLV